MKLVVALASVALACVAGQSALARSYSEIMEEAQKAFAADDIAAASNLLDEAQKLRPYSMYVTRNRVLARVLTGRMDEAIVLAAEVAERGIVLETPPHEAFDRLKAAAAYAPVAARMETNARPIGEADVIFESDRTDLLPEAIARRKDAILVGSARTGAILEISNGLMREVARVDGGVFDLEVAGGAAAVAAVNNQLAFERSGQGEPTAAIMKINLNNGEILSRTEIQGGDALLGDIEVTAARAYASDSITPRLFAQEKDLGPRVMATDARFVNLQGLALDKKRKRLYVADYLTGLFVIDLDSGTVDAIGNPTGAHLGGIDGLYLYKGDLIGVQNGVLPHRIVRIDLDKAGAVAIGLRVLQQALPEWNEPTHGFVDGDRFVYIATSNWPAYDDEGNVRDGAELAPLRIMSVTLE